METGFFSAGIEISEEQVILFVNTFYCHFLSMYYCFYCISDQNKCSLDEQKRHEKLTTGLKD